MQRTITAAAVQAEPVWLDLQATVDKTIQLIHEAAENGADLVAFPETFIPGYPWWIWLDSPADGMRFVPGYAANSMSSTGPEMERIRAAARDAGVSAAPCPGPPGPPGAPGSSGGRVFAAAPTAVPGTGC